MSRTIFAGILATLVAAPIAADAKEFRFGTNWLAQAEHGGYYQAMVDGTYAACGLEVTIVPGGPQVNGRAQMLAGRLDAYMGSNMLEAFSALAQDIPLVVVAANFQKEPQVLMTHPGRVASFEEIGSQGLGVMADELSFQTWYQIFVKHAGFKDELREPYTFNPAPFIADENKAQQGYVTSEPYAVEQATGWKPDLWLLADHGFEGYSTTVEMLRPFVDANEDVVRCFVDGTAIGWYTYIYGDNAAANARIKQDNPDISDGQLAYSLAAMKEHGIVDSGDSLTLGINAMTHATIDKFYNAMVSVGVVEEGLNYQDAYTLKFVNKGVGLELKKKLTGN